MLTPIGVMKESGPARLDLQGATDAEQYADAREFTVKDKVCMYVELECPGT